jgi:lysine biosynthesis protein LysW
VAETYCVSYNAVISVDSPRTGAMITCGQCGTELEIISTNPSEAGFAIDYDEDWDDEE